MVAITAVEGLARGNPVSPRYDMPREQDPDVKEMRRRLPSPKGT